MVWLESALNVATIIATIIATFRAGSRVLYLSEHSAIGVVDGPLILPPPPPPLATLTDNATTDSTATDNSNNHAGPTLYEIAEAFRHCVRLSLYPQTYEGVVRRVENPVDAVIEEDVPYSLSPYGNRRRNTKQRNVYDTEDEDDTKTTDRDDILSEVDNVADSIRNSSSSSSSDPNGKNQSRKWCSFPQLELCLPRIDLASIKDELISTKEYIVCSPRILSSWIQRATRGEDKWDVDSENEEEDIYDLDYSILTDTTTTGGETINNSTKNLSHQKVSELSVISPERFSNLRSIFGISDASFDQSMLHSGPFVSFQSNSKGAARVGGVFFFTRDGAYMIKTIKTEEANALLRMLPKYHTHMKRFGRKSLLTRICGMYGVRIRDAGSAPDSGELHTVVVMNSVFPAEASRFITERFDLKGSTVGRQVSEEERRSKGANAVLKDLDLAQEVTSDRSLLATAESRGSSPREYGLHVGAVAKAGLMSQLRHDVKLLVESQVMDYSLLVGVVDMDSYNLLDFSKRRDTGKSFTQQLDNPKVGRPAKKPREKKVDEVVLRWLAAPVRLIISPPLFCARRLWTLTQWTISSVVTFPMPYYGSGRCGVDGGALSVLHGTRRGHRAVYYMGLIDFLQPWTTRKVLEREFKGLMGYDKNAISCVTPEEYASRFLKFIDAHVT